MEALLFLNSKKFLRLLSNLLKLDEVVAFRIAFVFKLDENNDNCGVVVLT